MRALIKDTLSGIFLALILGNVSLAATVVAPVKINQPAILSSDSVVLTETNSVLRARGRLKIKDADSPRRFVAQRNVAGSYGTFKITSRGSWTYITSSALDTLKEGESVEELFTVSSVDGTTSTVKVTINGSNDAAILRSASITLDEVNASLESAGKLSISDLDSSETFVVQRKVKGKNGIFNIDSTGAWDYSTSSAFDELKAGQRVSDNFIVTSEDGTSTNVKITIKGSNDPAILGDASVVLEEANEVLNASGTLSARDIDSPQTFLSRKNLKGDYGKFSIDKTGAWKYVTGGALDKLGIGQSVNDNFEVSSSDGTKTTVKVTIKGTNDPAVLGKANIVLDETNVPLKPTGQLSIRDKDNPETFVEQNKVKGKNGIFSIDSTGSWTYSANSAFDEMNVGQSIDDSFEISSSDGTKTTVKVTINGTNDPAVMSAVDLALQESNVALRIKDRLSIKDVDSPATFIAQDNIHGKNGTFNISSSGRWSYNANDAFDKLNIGQKLSDSFTVFSADGTTTTVKVDINGTNDPAILSTGQAELTETNEILKAAGKLSISDVDNPATFATQHKFAGEHGIFDIDSAGSWRYVSKDALDWISEGKSIIDSYTVAATDGTKTTVKITINGTNDAAILGKADVVLEETNASLKPTGTLTIRDVDSPETFVEQRNIEGQNGKFSIDFVGKWRYVANSAFDVMNIGQSVNDNFEVSSSDGTKTTVKVTIKGTNDPAVLGKANIVLDETNAPLKPTGQLSIRDKDNPETFVEQNKVKGKNGIFSIDSTGSWTYSANSAFDEMNVGQSIDDSFEISSSDGTKTTVKVTINGTNDPAVMSVVDLALQESNVALRIKDRLSIKDVDSPATFIAQDNIHGKNGTFNISSSGRWSYNANDAFDKLNIGQKLSDSFTVFSADGTTTTVKVDINGTNDPAILSTGQAELTETNEILKAAGKLSISDVDNPATFATQHKFAGEHGIFDIDSAGSWRYVSKDALDWISEGKSISSSYTVAATDGTKTTVKITINGTNDAAILGKADVVLEETNASLKPTGTLTIRDVDSPETFVEQRNIEGQNGKFSIDSVGKWRYVANSAFDVMNIDHSVRDSFDVVSSDGTPTLVKVTIIGTNDPAVIGATNVPLTETNELLSSSGTLTIRDVDSPEYFVAKKLIKGKNGTFSINSDGSWSYLSSNAFDRLGDGQSANDSYSVSSADGTTAIVKVIINGTNDPASLEAESVTLRETNSVRRTGGRLNIIDVDSPMSFEVQGDSKGGNGVFSIDSSGRWRYVANSAFDELNIGHSISDSFKVISQDGTSTTVEVTIEGSEESRFDGGWVGGKVGFNRSNLDNFKARSALTYGIEEGYTWKLAMLQLGLFSSFEINNTASGPTNYSSSAIVLGVKLGLPMGKWLPYGKLALARTNGSDAAEEIGASHAYRALGLEYKLDDNWSIAAEYASSTGDTKIEEINNKLKNRNLTIGLNYYFGVAPVKVVAKARAKLPQSPSQVQPAAASQEPAVTPAFGPTPASEPTVEPAFGPAPTSESKSAPKPAKEAVPEPAFVPAF